jgi:UDP-N-acetylmuramyl pentapeptide synthase
LPILEFKQLSYDSRAIKPQTLFICKGQRFNPQYLVDAVKKGATACLTQQVYDEELAGQTSGSLSLLMSKKPWRQSHGRFMAIRKRTDADWLYRYQGQDDLSLLYAAYFGACL